MPSGVLQGCFRECYGRITGVLQECYRGCNKGVKGVLQECYLVGTGVLQGY